MKKLLFIAVTAAVVGVAVPASAQFYVGGDPGGVGVQVGPFGAGVGPSYGWGPRHRYSDVYSSYNYAGDCRVVRERTVTPRGRTIIRTHRVCD